MKVAIIIERYDISLGGAEWLVFELASALSQLGVDVDILAAQGDSNAANVHILCQAGHSKRISLATFAKLISNYIARNHYDIIHSVIPLTFADVYQPPGGSFAEAIIRNAASYSSKLVSAYKKATAFTNWRRTEMLWAEKKLCRNPNGPVIAALSNYVKDQFINHYNLESERIALVPNGVKVNNEADAESAKKLKTQIIQQLAIKSSANPVFFLFGANNFRLKGLNVLMEALALLDKSQTHRIPYLLVAGGGKINKFRSLAEKMDLGKKIVFLGHLPNIQNAMSISDVAVLPTFYDPCSRYILEALAACKPVITTKFNGASDFFVNNRHGKVLDTPENIDALAEAIRYFTDTKNIENASQAIIEDNLKENISIDRSAGQLIDVFESILKRKGRQ
jgi:UDP-glucose:(heptosyl)LPS alpha-1,3-glucosyltransferase